MNLCHAKESFFELEELGVSEPRRCGVNCNHCSTTAQVMTVREQTDKITGVIMFSYPNTNDVSKLKDNRDQVVAIESTAKSRIN